MNKYFVMFSNTCFSSEVISIHDIAIAEQICDYTVMIAGNRYESCQGKNTIKIDFYYFKFFRQTIAPYFVIDFVLLLIIEIMTPAVLPEAGVIFAVFYLDAHFIKKSFCCLVSGNSSISAWSQI